MEEHLHHQVARVAVPPYRWHGGPKELAVEKLPPSKTLTTCREHETFPALERIQQEN